MTYTMLGFCRRSGEIGIAAATTSIAVGARLGQWVRAGDREWMIASQAVARPGLGFEAGDLLAAGTRLDALEAALARADPHLAYRQLGVLEKGGSCLVISGAAASDWKGHAETEEGLAVGNALAGPDTVAAMAAGFAADPGADLAERLVRALEGGRDAGGQADAEGRHQPELSAFVRVFNAAADPFVYGGGRSPLLDLRVDYDLHAVEALRRLYRDCRPLRAAYELRARDPETYRRDAPGWEAALYRRDGGTG